MRCICEPDSDPFSAATNKDKKMAGHVILFINHNINNFQALCS